MEARPPSPDGPTGAAAAAPVEEALPEPTPGELVKEIAADLSTLVRKEVELAKAEISELVRTKLRAAAAGALGLLLVLLLIPLLVLGAIEILTIWLPRWGATLIVTGAIGALAVVAFLIARKHLKSSFMPERSIDSIRKDVEWAKTLKRP